MPIDFPSNPTVGQKYTYNSIIYTFTAQGTWTASANISQYSDPILNGAPTAPAAIPTADNSIRIANTQFVQSVVAAAIAAIPPPPPQFAAGTTMIFKQSTAPVGWTKSTTDNDKALRVVSGSVASGGVQPFSTAFGRTAVDNTTLDGNTLPAHAHSVADPTHNHGVGDPGHGHGLGDPGHAHGISQVNNYVMITTAQNRNYEPGSGNMLDPTTYAYLSATDGAGTGMWVGGAGTGLYLGAAGTGIGIYNAGGSVPHSHGIDLRVQYVDVIVAVKN
jgi:hypothetical protein